MEKGHPQPSPPEIPAKHRSHDGGAQQFDEQRHFEDEAGQANDPAHFRSGDGLLHGAALHQGDFSPGDHGKGRSHRDDTHAADLNQDQDHDLTEHGPIGRRIMKHQTGHTNG